VDLAGQPWASGLDTEETLPSGLRDPFLKLAAMKRKLRGQSIVAQGSNSDEVYLILNGLVEISLLSPSGRKTVLRNMGPGRLIGELSALLREPRSADAEAVEDVDLAYISGEAFRSFLSEEPGAGFWIAQQLASRVKNLTAKAVELATMPLGHRVQSELLRLAVQAGIEDSGEIPILPTHADLAWRIGGHREAVTRELGLLAREGIVRQSGRKLAILSMSRLIAVAARTAR